MPFFNEKFVTQIESGYSHYAAKTRIGDLFMWGNNSDGRMFH